MKMLLVHPGVHWAIGDWFDGLHAGLEAAGHEIHVYQLQQYLNVADRWLAEQWAELGSPEDHKPSSADVNYRASSFVLERALRLMPDMILIIAAMHFHPDFLLMLRRAGFKVAIVFTESPYADVQQLPLARFANVVTTNERLSVGVLQSVVNMGQGGQAIYLPPGFLPERHYPAAGHLAQENDDDDVPAHDLVFVGTLWPERRRLFEAMAASPAFAGVDVALYGFYEMAGVSPELVASGWVKGHVQDNARTARLYQKAKIGLNLHRYTPHEAESTNNRVYELAASGLFFATDARQEVTELFGDAVPTFRTVADLGALVQHWLPRDAERAARGRALAHRMADHTWAARARTLEAALTTTGD